MPRPRFTMRWLIVAVAVVAVALGAIRLKVASRYYSDQAAIHKRRYVGVRLSMVDTERAMAHAESISEFGMARYHRKWLEYLGAKASRHDAMRAKYTHAAPYPRLTVAPDPPEPERGGNELRNYLIRLASCRSKSR